MKLGVQLTEGPVFDLRVVPIIFATLMFRNPWQVLVIGLGIAAARYGVNGISPNAVTGSINITILAAASVGLVLLYKRKQHWSYRLKATISLLTINILQVSGIAIFGAVSRETYLKQIMPYTLPLSIIMGAFFIFIIYDFYKEQLLSEELRFKNSTLVTQKQELIDTHRELESKAREIVRSSKYKSDFLSNMSHELRTPLNSIILLSELIRDHEETGEHSENHQYAQIINSSSQELLRIINDILDLSKVEAGKMDMDWGEISVEDITQLMYHQIAPLANQKNLVMQVVINEKVPALIVSDGLRLNQILRNLLSNAVKFTEYGSVSLEVTTAAEPDMIMFLVKDTGIGIDEEYQQLVFDAFLQEDSTINRKYEGTGLGLSISYQLAKLLGGDLTLKSKKGEGSEFSLRLPINKQSRF
ncbi:ATP-binding protein [Paenibacillus sinopodophylli]|uniref:ATP-binding protein n=1 Tax=Paenibacillus sinopodophylli TaxID=1837342 RepID=UPI001486B96E|nr:ATP-binding protein [Paenibacillus sinopodophylli]